MKPAHLDVFRAFFLTLFVFGLLTWFYVVAIQVTHPGFLSSTLTHVDFFPLNLRVDVVGIVAFIVAVIGFFCWQLTLKRK